jgi:hypothetical protein
LKKLIVGLIISAGFIYLSFRNVQLGEVAEKLGNIDYKYIFYLFFISIISLFLRSKRWAVIISPIEKIPQKVLFPISCVGIMATVLFPMRIGEIMRPYLLSNKSKVSLSPGLATIFIERTFDLISLFIVSIIMMLSTDLPSWVMGAGWGFLATIVALIGFIIFYYFKADVALKLIYPILKRLSTKHAQKINDILTAFKEGFSIIANPRLLLYTFSLSILVWGCGVLSTYCMLRSVHIETPFIVAIVVFVITTLGISLPTAPGFVGNIQYGSILALSLYNIPKEDALAFSFVYQIVGIGLVIVIGLLCLPAVDISFKTMKEKLFKSNKNIEQG